MGGMGTRPEGVVVIVVGIGIEQPRWAAVILSEAKDLGERR